MYAYIDNVLVQNVTNISAIPQTLNATPQVTLTVLDNEGDTYALYADAQGKSLEIWVDEGGNRCVFIGRVREVDVDVGVTTILGEGISAKLEDTPYNTNYLYTEGRVASLATDYKMNVTQNDQSYTAFAWTADQWKDYGLLLEDHSANTLSTTWNVDSESLTNLTAAGGTIGSLAVVGDAVRSYLCRRLTASVRYTVGSDATKIADSNFIQKLTLRFACGYHWFGKGKAYVYLNDTAHRHLYVASIMENTMAYAHASNARHHRGI